MHKTLILKNNLKILKNIISLKKEEEEEERKPP